MSSHFPPPPVPVSHSLRPRQRGFALLITITLLAFLVLLLVSLASLTRVETQVAANTQQLAQARQNALMALNIAIGQLQQAAGPDQRVTARAEILDTNPTTPAADGVKQPFWTGVWKTGAGVLDPTAGAGQRETSTGETAAMSASAKATAAKTKAEWLVSRLPSATAPDPSLPTVLTVSSDSLIGVSTTSLSQSGVSAAAAAATPTGTVLARSWGLLNPSAAPSSTNQPYVVAAPMVSLDTANSTIPGLGSSGTSTIGRYAYWVSDEGVKAKVNYKEPNFSSTSLVQQQSHFLGAQGLAIHKIFPSGSFTDLRANGMLSNVLSLNQLNYLSTTTPGPVDSQYQPDITTQGFGVLADVRKGGLKKDLTAAFEDPTQFQQLLSYSRSVTGDAVNDEKLYRAPGLQDFETNVNLSGLRWLSLYNHYNIYKDAIPNPTPGGPSSPFKGAFGNSQTPASNPVPSVEMRSYRFPAGTSGYGADQLTPRLLGIAIYIGLSSESTPGGYKLKLHYSPQMILYNPYNVTLTAPPPPPAGFTPEFRYVSNMLSVTWSVKVGANDVITSKSIATNDNSSGTATSNIEMSNANTANLTFSPGQVRIYGINADDPAAKSLGGLFAANFTLRHDGVAGASRFAYLYTNRPSGWQQWTGATTTAGDSVVLTLPTNISVSTNNSLLRLRGVNAASSWPGAFAAGSDQPIVSRLLPSQIVPNPNTSIDLGPIGNLTTPQYFLQLIVKVKGTTSTVAAYPLFARTSPAHNPLSYIQNQNSTDVVLKAAAGINPKTDPNGLKIDPITVNNSFWGRFPAGTDPSDNANVNLIDIPRQPLFSVGQLQHVQAQYVANHNPPTGIVGLVGLKIFPQTSIGGSLPSAFLDTTKSSEINGGSLAADDNFLSNEVLFDSYFFSAVPHGFQAANRASFAPLNQTFDDAYIAAGNPLPNSRIKYYTDTTPPVTTDLRDLGKAAGKLVVDGAFNINSTSVNAWKAVLSASSGSDYRSFSSSGVETPLTASTLNNPVLRLATPVSAPGSTTNAAWNGIRTLDDPAITSLATAIVDQVKQRGPFLSMADFVNRRLVANTNTKGLKGALQEAIDSSGINTAAITGEGVTTANINNGAGYPGTGQPGNLPGINTATGIPGWIMQQDLLQALSPILSARSDCFTIRTYGESINPATGSTVSTAYLEAVVQRVPDWVNKADPAENAVLPENIQFGRRFKIVSLRWLTREDL